MLKPYPRHKYNAKQTIRDGIKFSSKREANYYDELLLKQRAGLVLFFLRQVPFDLPGGVKHRIDFLEFHTNGTCRFVEVKGYDTPNGKLKRKLVEAIYPIVVEVV